VPRGPAADRSDLYDAIMEGRVERARPKMMTVVAIMAGLPPIMWSTGTGSEIIQRIALPMIGGMVSSTLLMLIVIPRSSGCEGISVASGAPDHGPVVAGDLAVARPARVSEPAE
jgi:hypothetical protein